MNSLYAAVALLLASQPRKPFCCPAVLRCAEENLLILQRVLVRGIR